MLGYNNEPTISVGILINKNVVFELYGDFKSAGHQKTFSGRFNADVQNNKIVVRHGNEKFEFDSEAYFEPLDPAEESFLLRDVTIGVQFHWERKEKQRFKGILKLLLTDGKIQVINILPIEKYLVSVISSEMSSKCSLHLLKAHAIVSRSWLLAQIEKSKVLINQSEEYSAEFDTEGEHIKWYDREDHKLFDVCADDHCQRYQGITKIFTDIAVKAVNETSGMVLTSNDEICDARYYKACGGLTEEFQNVWEPVNYPYLTSVIDYKYEPEAYNTDYKDERAAVKWIKGNPPAFCNSSEKKILTQILPDFDQETKDFFRWKIEYSQEELKSLLLQKSGIDFGDIIDLQPVERGKSFRLIKLKIIGTKKILIIGKELEIRKFLSASHLYSSAIVIERQDIQNNIPGRFVLYGAGWGHGVGLCQIGAAVMADRGYKFDEILSHYFRDARLKKVY
jgi:stage II sporulation protein D